MEHCLPYLDLQDDYLDPETFADILVLQYLCHVFLYGKPSEWVISQGQVPHTRQLRRLVDHALEAAQRSQRFEAEWHLVSSMLSDITSAWDAGYHLFQEEWTEATSERRQIHVFSNKDEVVTKARSKASIIYERDRSMQIWFTNGYLDAWQQHFGVQVGNEKI